MARPRPRKRPLLSSLNLDPEKLASPGYRSTQVNLRLTPDELDSIKAMAKALNLSMSDYLLGLHLQAVKIVSRKKKEK